MLMKHAEEELCLLGGDEMQNVALYWQHIEEIIARHIHTMNVDNDQLAKSLVSLLDLNAVICCCQCPRGDRRLGTDANISSRLLK